MLCVHFFSGVGTESIQRDPDKPEKWVCVNLERFYKAMGKVLHVGQINAKRKHLLGMKGWRPAPSRRTGSAGG